jgi:HPr kinase/phosphorylase
MMYIHGTCVVVDGMGVLIRGPSGSGKSDLAMRLIERGGLLVADDQVQVVSAVDAGGRASLLASAPANLFGLVEARGVGVVRLNAAQTARQVALALVVDLVETDGVERYPDAATTTLADIALPRIALAGMEASAPFKLTLALKCIREPAARVTWVGA